MHKVWVSKPVGEKNICPCTAVLQLFGLSANEHAVPAGRGVGAYIACDGSFEIDTIQKRRMMMIYITSSFLDDRMRAVVVNVSFFNDSTTSATVILFFFILKTLKP